MNSNQAEILEKLLHMKKELARKEKKLKKCARAVSAKEHVKRRLREQEVLEGKANAHHLTSDFCVPSLVSSDTCQTYKSPHTESSHSTAEVGPNSEHLSAHFNTNSGDNDGHVEIISIHSNACLKPKEHKSKHFNCNSKEDDVISAHNCKHVTDILPSESDSDKSLNWNSSNEMVSSAEHQSKRSLSLKRKRNVSKRMADTSTSKTNPPVNLTLHTDGGVDHIPVQRTPNMSGKSASITDCISYDEEKLSEVVFKQVEKPSPLKQKNPIDRLKKPEPSSENSKVRNKSVKRRRRTIGRILDIDLEKDVNFQHSSESSQNSEEYETLRLIQESYRSGVDYSTRHGKTHNLPSMLSSIFQYFIDENRRQKEPSDFSLPVEQFGRMIRKRLKVTTGKLSDNSKEEEMTDKYEHHIDESSLNSIEASKDLFHPDTRGTKSAASFPDYSPKFTIQDDLIRTEKVSGDNLTLANQSDSKAGGVNGDKITPIIEGTPHVSEQCPLVSCDHTKHKHNKGCDSDHMYKNELLSSSNSSLLNKDIKVSRNCFKGGETPKYDTESCDFSEEHIPLSPALFGSPPDSQLGTGNSSSVGDCDSQDSQLISIRRVNKGERLKHLGCIKFSQQDSLRCVAACCIQIVRRRTDVLLCIGQSTMSLWNQRGDNYTCIKSWKLEEDYNSVECYTFPAVFRDKFCYFLVVLRGVGCTAQVVHYNARTDHPQLVQCLQANSVTACCLSVEALAVGDTNQDKTRVTKYSMDCDGQLTIQQEFDPSPGGSSTPRCLKLVENLQSALALWSSTNTLVLWNTETGTLVWTLDLSLTWPEMSTLVTAEWQQEYLLLSLLTDKKSDDAGVLLVVNPETEVSKVLVQYTATSWEGVKCIGQLEDSIAATDHRGQTCVWDPYSGQLSYQCDPCTGIKGLGCYWRKLVTMYDHCVHIFK
ncbi:uncharacterized protein LOC117333097 [Pecten maximus]|uniref:uncharacterized protein LOC117333097 n=1 Tax=Pecten maximus TaxID=6579 RepID=UPI001458476E|nr:uncharacterized protein LOC117333097 [Pecten maximus]